MNQLKMFTLHEANQLIPDLSGLVQKLQKKKKEILAKEVEIDALELIHDSKEDHVLPGIREKVDLYENAVNEFYMIIDEIHQRGCFLKDVDMGLIDFYTVYKGRVVYLCWRYGEDQVSCWHDIGQGYPHRQPLEVDKES